MSPLDSDSGFGNSARAASKHDAGGNVLQLEPLEPRILLSADLNPLHQPVLLSNTAPIETNGITLSNAPLSLSSVQGPTDPAPTVSGSLAVPGQTDQYSFTLSGPKQVYFDSLTNRYDITWSLTGPSGAVVTNRGFAGSDADGISGPAAFQLGAGSYTLTVQGNGATTGDYAFRLLDLAKAQPITPGAQVSQTLSPGNRTDAFQFDGTAGERVYLNAQSGGNLYWRVLDPNGQLVGGNYFSDQQLTLPSTGTYTILVEGRENNTADSAFKFTVYPANDTTAALTLNTRTDGTVSQPGQINNYTFTVGGETRLAFDTLGGNSSLQWSLTGPRGTEVSGRSLYGSDSADGDPGLDLPAGSYTLSVSGSGATTGSYAFRLLDFAAATPIAYGTAVSDTLGDGTGTAGTPGTETRAYSITVTAGDQVQLVASQSGGIYYRLFDPYGKDLGTNYLTTAPTQTLLVSGTYTLLIEGRIYDSGPATFSFTASKSGNVALPALTGTALTLGTPVSGTSAAANENDDYVFTVAAPAHLVFTPLATPYTGAGGSWQLDGPQGSMLTGQSFYYNQRFDVTAPGTYRIRINPSAAGQTYNFQVTDLAAAPALTLGSTVSGTLTPGTATAFYSFSAHAGDRISAHAISGSSLNWRLIDAYGRDVFNNGFGDTNAVTLPSTGTYTLQVFGAYYNANPTNFSFAVTRVMDSTAALTLGARIDGTIPASADTANYTFTLAQPTLLYMDALSQNGNFTWTVTGPLGVEVSSTALAEYGNRVVNVPAGQYTLSIRASNSTTGAFSFQLLDLGAAAAVKYGDALSATLTPPQSTASWKFAAAAGDRIDLSPYLDTDNYGLRLRIIDPSGNDLWGGGGLSNAGPLTLAVAGTYTILVEGYWYDPNPSANVKLSLFQIKDGTQAVSFDGPAQTGPLSVPGQGGSALAFTGVQSVTIPNGSAVDQRTTTTIEFWMKPDSFGNPWSSIIYKGDGSNSDLSRSYSVWLNSSGYVLFSSMDSGGDNTVRTPDGSVAIGLWTHVAVVMDRTAGTAAIYLNGQLAASGTVHSGPANGGTYPVQIGAAVEGNASFVGVLQNVALFSTARTGAQVAADMNAIPAAGTPGLQLALPMNDASGATSLNETSGNGLAATAHDPNAGLSGVVTGLIATPGQAQRYTFNLATPQLLAFDALTDNSQLTVTITGPNGLNVSRNMRNGDGYEFGSGNPIIAAPAGNYTITVTDAGNRTDGYAFRLLPLADAQPITTNAPVSLTLNQGAATQAYSFVASAGDKFLIDVLSDNKSSDRADFRLIDPNGNQVFGPNTLQTTGPFTLGAGGVYTLLVEGRVWDPSPLSIGFALDKVVDATIPLTLGVNPAPGPLSDTGQIGGALRLTGSDAVSVPASAALDLTNNVTVEAWINVDRLPSTWAAIIYKGEGRPDAYNRTYSLWLNSNGSIYLGTSATGWSGSPQGVQSAGGLIGTGQWHHIAGVIDRTNGLTHLYIDGVDVGDGTLSNTLAASEASQNLLIGTTSELNNAYSAFQGRIDDVRVWNTARSAAQIAGAKDAPLANPASQPGLALYLPFDTVATSTTPDLSANATTAQLLRFNADGVTGAIHTPGQTVNYTFTLANPTTLVFDSQTDQNNFSWSLTGPSGIMVNNRPFTSSDANRGNPLIAAPAGTYTLSVTAGGDATGSYNFRLFDLASATPITPGVSQTVALNPGNRAQAYSFTATAGERVYFDTRNSLNASAMLRVIDPLGRDLYGLQNADDLRRTGTQTLALPGTYTVLADSDVYSDPNLQSFSMKVVPVVDKTVALTLGTAVSGSIDQPGQAANYTFTLAGPARTLFDSLTNDGSLFWTLTGPNGTVVSRRGFNASDSYDFGGSTELDLPAGQYTLSITQSEDGTSPFAFNLLDMSAATTLVTNTPVSLSQAPQSTVLYKFSGLPGDTVQLVGAPTAGDVSWRLFDPFGHQVFGPQWLAYGSGTIAITSSGTYVLAVEGRITNGTPITGAIELVPESVPAVDGAVSAYVPATASTPVDLGVFGPGTYHLAAAGVASLVSGFGDTNALLFNPDGTLFVPTTRSGFTGLNSSPQPNGGGTYGVGGPANNLGALLGTTVASPASAADYFTIGSGKDVTLAATGHLYAQVNDWPNAYGDNNYGFTVTVKPAGASAPSATSQDFSGAAGLSYDLTTSGQPPTVIATGAGGNALRLANGTNSTSNGVFFSTTQTGLVASVTANFDFRIAAFAGNRADGFGVGLLPVAQYGSSGPGPFLTEEPSVSGVFGLGFDIYNNGGIDPNNNHIAVYWNGNLITTIADPGFDLANGAFNHVQFVLTRSGNDTALTLTVTPSGGTATKLLDAYLIPGMDLTASRLAIGARTGGQTSVQDFTNVAMTQTAAASDSTSITIGTPVSGSLAQASGVARYGFDLASPARLVFDSLTDAPYKQWTLTGPTGTIVVNRSFDGSDSADFGSSPVLALTAGHYTLAVSSSYGDTGNFSFRLLDLAAATPITLGTPASTTLDPGNGTQAFSFNATAGDHVVVTNVSGWNGSQYYILLDPNGNQIIGETPLAYENGPIAVPISGTYTFVVAGRYYQGSPTTIGFSISTETDTSAALVLNTRTTGALTQPGQSARYTFTLNAATELLFSSQANGNFRWSLTGPGGVSYANATPLPNGNSGVIAAPQGDYTLTITGGNPDTTGAYGFALYDLGQAGQTITPGTTMSGTLNPASSAAVYRLSGVAGQSFYFDAPNHTNNVSWQLIDPYGQSIFNTNFQSQGVLALPRSGSYVLLVQGYVYDSGTADYSFTVYPQVTNTAALTLGATTSGALTAPGQTSNYTFTLAAPTRLLMAALSNAVDTVPYGTALGWTLTGPNGTVLSRNFDYSAGTNAGSSTPAFDLPAGAYTLSIGTGTDQTGTYSFRLLDLGAATPLVLGSPVSGTLSPGSDTRAYSFSATAGDRAFFQQTSYTGGNLIWRLIDPNNGIVFYTGFYSSPGQVVLPLTGTYTLTLEGYIGNAASNVGFGFTAYANPVSNPVPINSVGGPVAPDLVVQNLGASGGAQIQSGGNVTISWKDVNAGTASTDASWTDRVILRRMDTQEILANVSVPVAGPLAAGQSAAQQVTVKLPDGNRGAGALTVSVTTDVGNTVAEANGDGTAFINNVSNLSINSALAPYPDLQVSNVQLTPASGYASGDKVTAAWMLTNAGTAATAVDFTEQVTIRNTVTNQVIELFSDVVPAGLAASASQNRSINFNWPSGLSSTGSFTVQVTADSSGVVLEAVPPASRTDNTASTSVLSAPDLAMLLLSVTNASPVQSGDTVNIAWTDANLGNAPTASTWSDRVRVVNKTTSAVLIDTSIDAGGVLAPGLSRSRSYSFALPQGAAGVGDIQIAVTADQTPSNVSVITEATASGNPRDNNVGTVAVAATLRTYPDLVPALTAPATGRGGSSVALSWTVTNGNGAATTAGSWTDKVILSTTPTIGSASDVVLGTFTHTGDLAPNGSYQQSKSVTLPGQLQGTFYITLVTDSGNAVLEPDTRAHTISAPSTIAITSPAADLVTSAVSAPASASAGAAVTVTWTVTNNGDGATSTAQWHDRLYLSQSSTPQPGDVYLGELIHNGVLAAAGSYNASTSVTLPGNAFGNYRILVVTDATGLVYENGATANNAAASGPILLQSADLKVTNVTVPTALQPGQYQTVSWTVTNAGTGDALGYWYDRVLVSTTGKLSDAAVLADAGHNGGLGAGQSYTGSALVHIPAVADGTLTFFVVTDNGRAVSEAGGHTDNVGLSTGSSLTHPNLAASSVIAPSTALAGNSMNVRWTVTSNGTAAATGTWNDQVYVASGTTLDGTQRYLGSLPHTGLLTSGSSYNASLNVQLPADLANGPYHVIVVANGDGALNEAGSTADNAAVSAVLNVTQPPLPDLQVVGLSVTPNSDIRSGNTLMLGWSVRNAGLGNTTNSFYTHVTAVNTTTGKTIADQQLYYDAASNGAIMAGTAATQSLAVKLPDGDAGVGQIQITVTTDSFGQVYEGAGPRNDNTATITRTSTLQDYPDLTVDGLSVTSSPVSGGPLTLAWTTTNHGAAAANAPFSDEVVVINQTTGQTLADQSLPYDPAASGAIAAGAGVARTLTITLPDGAPGVGQLLVRVIADSALQVPEHYNAGRTDNVATKSVASSLAAYPALAVTNVASPSITQAGATITVTYTVANNGSGPASGSAVDTIAIAGKSGMADTPVFSQTYSGENIPAGGTVNRTATFTLPANIEGVVTFAVTTDATQRIFQTDRSGNRAISATTLIQPALSITLSTLSVPETAGAAALTATVARSGGTANTLTVTLAADPTLLTAPATVTIPAGQSGATVTLGVVDDGLVDGTRTGTLTASATGLASGSATLAVTNSDIAFLTLNTATSTVAKNSGALSFTLTRNAGLTQPLTVTLSSDDASRILPPPSVTFAAGQSTLTFNATVIDNGLVEGLRQVNVNATASGYVNATSTVTLTDSNVPSLTLQLGQNVVSEAAGSNATTLTITRDKGVATPVELLLQTNIGQIRIPAHVGFSAGVSSISIPIALINNQQPASGSRVVAIQASVLDAGIGTAIPGTTVQTLLQINGSVGPTLAMSLDKSVATGGSTVTATLTRMAGDNTKALTVALSSSNTTEATVQPSVTFGIGQTTAQVTVTVLNDGAANSSTPVTILADASGYIEGSAGLTVTNRNLPDLQLSNVQVVPSTVGGQSVTVTYTVKNTGLLTATGPWVDQVSLATDVVLTPSSVLLGKGAGQTLAPGQSYTGVVTFKAPDAPGAYNVIVQTNADPASAVQELNAGNNFGSAPLTINPSYRATVAVGQHSVPAGTDIILSGTTYDSVSGMAAPFKIVSIHVTAVASGVVREVLAITDASGNYSTKFTPLSSELGDYTVDAAERGVTDRLVQDKVSLVGGTANTNAISISGLPGVTYTGSFQIANGSSVALTNLKASLSTSLPATATFTVQPIPNIPGNTASTTGTVTVNYRLVSTAAIVGNANLVITSAEGARISVPLQVSIIPAHATLVTNPGSLDTGMVVGTNSQVSFKITNTGGADSGPVSIVLPDVPYLSLSSPATIDNITPGASATVTVNLTPAADLALQEYKGAIAINSATSTTTEAFTLRAVTTATGGATIAVQDEYTFFAADKPQLAGANVTLADAYTGKTVATGVTGADGTLHVASLAAGPYTLIVTADQHATFTGTVVVKPGTDNQFTEFLHRQAVSYTWTVVPVPQTDSYTIKLQADFQTAVPMPVVTVDQPWIIALVSPGRVWQTEITLTNHGLIDAKDVSFGLPNDPNYLIQPLVDHIDTLPAGATVTIPIQISMKPGAQAAGVEVSDVAGLLDSVNHAALGQTQTIRPSALGGTVAACLGITMKYTYECVNAQWVQTPIKTDLISCGDAAYDAIKNLATSGNLLTLPCDALNLALSCLANDGPLSNACVQAALNAACKAVIGGLEGGPAGALAGATAGSWQDWLKCLCSLLSGAGGDGGSVTTGGGDGGFDGGGGYGGAGTPWDVPIGYGTPTNCDGSPASASAAPQSATGNQGLIATQDNSVCATVRLEIDQHATITRTAFSGTLDLNNGDPSSALSDVSMDLNVTDSNGVDSNAKFSITGPDTTNFINGPDGKLELQAGTKGVLHFTFLPTQDAAPNDVVTYEIGGVLHYIQNGTQINVTVAPAKIYVYPEAHLQLNYFWQRDVIGDDPFTPQVEPSEPFYLGVQATNVGKGTANDLTITSAQPKIIENEKGLLIDFKIIGSQVGNKPGTNSLTVDLGTIAPGQTATADWALLSSLQGKFKNFSASFTHDDDKGSLKTSLIDSVNIHELIQKVQVTPDGIASFLTSEVPDANHDPDTLWLGSGGQQHVSLGTNTSVSPGSGNTEKVTVTQQTGWSYFTISDPAPGLKLVKITRSDGKDIPIGDTAWRSDRTWIENQPAPVYENLIHILDDNGTGSYTLTYVSDDHTAPQVTSVTSFSGVQTTGPDEIDVQLNKLIDDTTFTASAFSLTLNGAPVTLSALTITDAGGGLFKVTGLAPFTAGNGNYAVSVDATQFKDAALNAGVGKGVSSFAVSNGPALVLSVSPVATPRNTPVGELTVTFSKAIDPASFDTRALTLTLNGTPVTLDSRVSVVPTSDPTVFRIDGLGTLSASDGTYVLSVNGAQAKDTTAVAGTGRLSTAWTLNTVGPTITALETIATNPRNTIVPTLTVTLSEPIDPASFDYRALTVTKDGGTQNLVTSKTTVTQVDPTHYALAHFNDVFQVTQGVSSSDSIFDGTYTLTVDATKLRDLAGNAGTGGASESWTLQITAPAAPSNLAISPDNGASRTDGVTNTTSFTVSGALAATGLTVRLTDLTTSTDLGYATVTGTAFAANVNVGGPGAHKIQVRSIDAAGNTADGIINVFIDTTPPQVLSFSAVAPSPRTTPVDGIDVTFSKAIDPATFTPAGVQLTLNGTPVALSGLTVTPAAGNTFHISGLTAFTAASGNYGLTLTNTVADTAGNTLIGDAAAAWTTAAAVRTGFGGVVYQDYNGNGSRDFGPNVPIYDTQETGLAGWTVYIDAQNSGAFDPKDPSAVTAADGSYSFSHLTAGTYTVRVSPPSGWQGTSSSSFTIPVATDQYLSASYDFGEFQLGTVSGVVFNDQNGTGAYSAGDTPLSGATVFIDKHGDNALHPDDPTAVTGPDGRYTFNGVGPGTLMIGEMLPTGYVRSSAETPFTVQSGYMSQHADIANVQSVTIKGNVFDDFLGSGARTNSDAGLTGWTVFLDTNNDALLDNGEISTVSDASGNYAFVGLLPGKYTVRIVQQAGYQETTPASPEASSAGAPAGSQQVASASAAPIEVDCACGGTWAVAGGVDLGAESVTDAANLTELTQARSDKRFANLLGQGTTTVVIDTGIDNSHPFFGAQTQTAGRADRIVYEYDFADHRADASDRNGHGSNVASLIASSDGSYPGVAPDANLIVLKVFDDNGNGNFGYVKQALDWVIANASTYHIGVVNMSFGDGGNWTTAASRYGLGGDLAAISSEGIITVAAAGNNYAQFNSVGVAYPGSDPSVVAVGSVWSGDFGGPWRVSTGAVDYTTGADHIAAYSQRDPTLMSTLAPGSRFNGANANGGVTTMQGTSQAAAYVSGAATLAQELAMQVLGRGLTTSEFAALLRSTGDLVTDGSQNNDNVRNTGLTFPRLDMEKLFQAILAYNGNPSTLPSVSAGSGASTITAQAAGQGYYTVTVAAGQVVSGKDFGEFKLGAISGTVFNDTDRNGIKASGEGAVANATVFVDSNGNGKLDAGEPSTSTDGAGHYAFGNLGPGSYTVRVVLPTGLVATSPNPATVTATSGFAATADFGEAVPGASPTASGPSQATIGTAYTINLSVSDPGQVIREWYVDWGDGTLQGILGNPRTASHVYARGGTSYTVGASVRDDTGIYDASSFSVGVGAPQQVTSVTHDGGSVSVRFNDAFDPAIIHLYNTATDTNGPADVTLVGARVGAIKGSLVFDTDRRGFTFVATAGLLAPDTYTVTLLTGSKGFHDGVGGLDGLGNGLPASGNYVTSFVIGSVPAASLSLPNLIAAPGQAINYAVGKTGVPITLANAAGLTSLDFHIDYDPSLLSVTGIAAGSVPAGTQLTVTTTTPGHAVFHWQATAPAAAGKINIGSFLAAVPSTAAYGQRQILRLTVDGMHGIVGPIAGSDELELAALLGDTDGNAMWDANDATLVQRVIVKTDSGFGAWPNVDPVIIGDVARAGVLASVDATRIAQQAANPTRPEFTPLPASPLSANPSVVATGLLPVSPSVTAAATLAVSGADLAPRLTLVKTDPMAVKLANTFADFSLANLSDDGLDWKRNFVTQLGQPRPALASIRLT